MRKQTFTLPWPPSVNQAYRSIVIKGQPRVLLSSAGRAYKERAAFDLLRQGARNHGQDRVAVLVVCYPPDRRDRDLGNLDKILIDSLEPRVFLNDSQIDLITWVRAGVRKDGLVEVTVESLSTPPEQPDLLRMAAERHNDLLQQLVEV